MIGTVRPPAILARLPAFQDWPCPSECPDNIAILICQPDAAGTQWYRPFIDRLPGLIVSFPGSSDPFPNHQGALAFGADTFLSEQDHHVSTTASLKGGSVH
jgi:hypothetical protein